MNRFFSNLLTAILTIAAIGSLVVLFWPHDSRANVLPIDDPAHKLTAQQATALQAKLMENYNQTKVHVVVWLPDLQKDDVLLDKAVAYFKEKGIGQKGVDSGVLLLIDWGNRRSRIEVGYGLEGIMTDAATKNLQDAVMVPFFKKGDLFGGILAGVDQLSQWSQQWAKGETPKSAEQTSIWWLVALILGMLLCLWVGIALLIAANRRREEAQRAAEFAEAARRQREADRRTLSEDAQRRARHYASLRAAGLGAAAGAAAASLQPRERFRPSPPKSTPVRSTERTRYSSSESVPYSGGGYSGGSSSSSSDHSSSSSSSSSSSYDGGGGSSGGGGSDSSW